MIKEVEITKRLCEGLKRGTSFDRGFILGYLEGMAQRQEIEGNGDKKKEKGENDD